MLNQRKIIRKQEFSYLKKQQAAQELNLERLFLCEYTNLKKAKFSFYNSPYSIKCRSFCLRIFEYLLKKHTINIYMLYVE